jgi:hypothetical protein
MPYFHFFNQRSLRERGQLPMLSMDARVNPVHDE